MRNHISGEKYLGADEHSNGIRQRAGARGADGPAQAARERVTFLRTQRRYDQRRAGPSRNAGDAGDGSPPTLVKRRVQFGCASKPQIGGSFRLLPPSLLSPGRRVKRRSFPRFSFVTKIICPV